jgi:hypothetical protein
MSIAVSVYHTQHPSFSVQEYRTNYGWAEVGFGVFRWVEINEVKEYLKSRNQIVKVSTTAHPTFLPQVVTTGTRNRL